MATSSQVSGGIGGAAQGASIGASVGGPWGAAIGGVIGGIGGILSGGGEDDAKKMAEEQAKLIELQTREDQRRKMLMLNEQSGLAKATTLTANLMDSGSSKKYRNFMENEYRRELAYDRYVGKKKAELAREGGAAAANAISSAGISSMISGLGSLGTAWAGGAFGSTSPLNTQGVAPTAAANQRAPAYIGT